MKSLREEVLELKENIEHVPLEYLKKFPGYLGHGEIGIVFRLGDLAVKFPVYDGMIVSSYKETKLPKYWDELSALERARGMSNVIQLIEYIPEGEIFVTEFIPGKTLEEENPLIKVRKKEIKKRLSEVDSLVEAIITLYEHEVVWDHRKDDNIIYNSDSGFTLIEIHSLSQPWLYEKDLGTYEEYLEYLFCSSMDHLGLCLIKNVREGSGEISRKVLEVIDRNGYGEEFRSCTRSSKWFSPVHLATLSRYALLKNPSLWWV